MKEKDKIIRLDEVRKTKNEVISGIAFSWDEEKEKENVTKHGLSFRTAARVFLDDNRMEIYDRWHASEERYNTIGLVEDVLFVVYTERRGNIRLISARVATSSERRLYYDRLL